MEPRPISKPNRGPAPEPAASYGQPGGERGAWSQPASPAPGTQGGSLGAYASPAPRSTQPQATYPSLPPAQAYVPPTDTGAPAWQDPSAMGGGPGTPGYSPGPALRPIDGGGARWLGPILALVLLAAVVGTVIFVVVRLLGDDDPSVPANVAGPSGTQVAAAAASPSGTDPATEEVDEPETTAEPESTAAGDDATKEPTRDTGDDATEEPRPTRTPTPASTGPTTARQMLPTSSDLPEGFERTEDDKRTRDDVAASFADPAEALANLEDWDWRENAYRTFENSAAASDPNATTYVNISVHRFGERSGTSKAVDYFADAVVAGQGLEAFEIEPIGDETIALKGAPEGVTLVVLYIREGNYLIRIGGSSPQGDPTDLLIDVAKEMLK